MHRLAKLACIVFVLAASLLCGAAAQRSGRARDSEGSAFSFMPEYVQWVNKSCGAPAAAANKSADCKALKDKMCGNRTTSEVLCLLTGITSGDPVAQFRSASRYTRVTYLVCSLTQLKCRSSAETYDPPARDVSPVSIAAWVQYVNGCVLVYGDEPKPSKAQCEAQSKALCGRPDVRCSSKDNTTEFLVPGISTVLLKGVNDRGLAYLQ